MPRLQGVLAYGIKGGFNQVAKHDYAAIHVQA